MKDLKVYQLLENRGDNISYVLERWDEDDNITVLWDEAENWYLYAEDIPEKFDKLNVEWFYIKRNGDREGNNVIAIVVE